MNELAPLGGRGLRRRTRGAAQQVDSRLQFGGLGGGKAVIAVAAVKGADPLGLAVDVAGFAAGDQAVVALTLRAAIFLAQLHEQSGAALLIRAGAEPVVLAEPP